MRFQWTKILTTFQVYITAKGQAQALGEYESAKALFAVIPDNVPRPIALGTLASNPDKHFLLVEFKDMAEELPPVPEFAAVIAKLHRDSESPNGKLASRSLHRRASS
jgi:protein-ribulosamine 3-kinase